MIAAAETTSAEKSINCPMCEYDLRGQVEPRCPECGYRFDWDELRDPARRMHPYLFEHHPERNIWSFFRTLMGGWRPRKFWATLYPTQPSRPRRLMIYFILGCLAGIVPMAANFGLVAAELWAQHEQFRAGMVASLTRGLVRSVPPSMRNLTPQQIVDRMYPPLTRAQTLAGAWHLTGLRALGRVQFALALWPVLTLAAMMVFQISMSRARVRAVHAVRCVVYSADLLIWVNVVLGGALVIAAIRRLIGSGIRYGEWDAVAAIALPLAWLFFAYRLTTSIRFYLQMDHPKSVVIATQVIALLALLVIMVELLERRW